MPHGQDEHHFVSLPSFPAQLQLLTSLSSQDFSMCGKCRTYYSKQVKHVLCCRQVHGNHAAQYMLQFWEHLVGTQGT